MIVKSDIGHLPATLRPQFANGVGRIHPLWRIASRGLGINDLNKRIEYHACMAHTGQAERAFKLNLADSDPIAIKLNELATSHKLAKSSVFEILVMLGWEALQTYGTQIASTPPHPTTADARQAQPSAHTHPNLNATASSVAPSTAPPEPAQTQPPKPPVEAEFCDTPEFADIAQNMLAQFGIDMGMAPATQQ